MAAEVSMKDIEIEVELWVRVGGESSAMYRVGSFMVAADGVGDDLTAKLTRIVEGLGEGADGAN